MSASRRERRRRERAAAIIQKAFRKFKSNRKIYGDPPYKDMDVIDTTLPQPRRRRLPF